MEFDFNQDINNFLKIITKCAQQFNTRVFFVGGIVRDNILKIQNSDYDLIIDKNAIEFANFLPNEIIIKSVHKDFGTIKVQYKNLNFDIASTRVEKYPTSGCLPLVEKIGVPIEIDVLRRDFSINSLYCEILLKNNELKFKLIDLVNGLNDIENRILRVLHNKSYIDDPTRILRGLDFKYRFNFDFSELDKKLISKYLKKTSYQNRSYDRILSVFKKILKSKYQIQIFKEIIEKKYYKILNSNKFEYSFDEIINIAKIFNINDLSDFFIYILENAEISKKPTDSTTFGYKFLKTKDENLIKEYKLSKIQLEINGDDLRELGFKGKIIGEIIKSLKEEILIHPQKFSNKNLQLNWIKRNYIPH